MGSAPNIIFHHGKIYTADAGRTIVEAVAVKDDTRYIIPSPGKRGLTGNACIVGIDSDYYMVQEKVQGIVR